MRWLVALLIAAGCSKNCPTCPTLPVRPVSPPVKVITLDPPTCTLPELPQPFVPVGYPSPDGQQIYVSRTDMAKLGVYLAGIRDWIETAAGCLEAP